MASPVDPPFRPARLDPKDLEVPVTAGMRCMPPEEMKRFHEREVKWHRQFDLAAPHAVRRMARYAAGCALGALLLQAVLHGTVRIGPGLATWWLQIPLGALYGAWFARTQPAPLMCGLAFAGVFLATSLASGEPMHLFAGVFGSWCWFLLGFLGGVAQQSKREEGMR